ncbi:MAG TPA: hypothetical protein VM911_22935 [Pyrinomonadaceae bacterium]|jgi:hypothetical protein|nr:hypothetical protein [Pyrinomonadaceae bacterium]
MTSSKTLQDNKEVVARGVLGGLVGHLIKCAVLWIILTFVYPSDVGYSLNIMLLVIFVIAGLLPATMLGVIAAMIIRIVTVRRGRNIRALGRVAIGILFMGIISGSAFLAAKYFSPGINEHKILSSAVLAIVFPDLGVAVGAAVGIISGKQYGPQ